MKITTPARPVGDATAMWSNGGVVVLHAANRLFDEHLETLRREGLI